MPDRDVKLTPEQHQDAEEGEKELLKQVTAASLLLDELSLPVKERPVHRAERTLDALDSGQGAHRDDGSPDAPHNRREGDLK